MLVKHSLVFSFERIVIWVFYENANEKKELNGKRVTKCVAPDAKVRLTKKKCVFPVFHVTLATQLIKRNIMLARVVGFAPEYIFMTDRAEPPRSGISQILPSEKTPNRDTPSASRNGRRSRGTLRDILGVFGGYRSPVYTCRDTETRAGTTFMWTP